jgi:hypothetical protein
MLLFRAIQAPLTIERGFSGCPQPLVAASTLAEGAQMLRNRGDPEFRGFRIFVSLEWTPEWDAIVRHVLVAVGLSLGGLLAALNLS